MMIFEKAIEKVENGYLRRIIPWQATRRFSLFRIPVRSETGSEEVGKEAVEELQPHFNQGHPLVKERFPLACRIGRIVFLFLDLRGFERSEMENMGREMDTLFRGGVCKQIVSPSLDEWAQEQTPEELVGIKAAVEFERGAFAEIALEDVTIVADGRKNPALPLLVQTKLLRDDRHRPGAADVSPRFRPLRADQCMHRPFDDRGPLRIVGSRCNHHREDRKRFR